MKNCKNGGKTIIDLKDGPGSDPYRCECAHGYIGDLCEIGTVGTVKFILLRRNKCTFHQNIQGWI